MALNFSILNKFSEKINSKLSSQVVDLDNGNYEVRFTPTSPGTYCLNVFIFARPIKVVAVVAVVVVLLLLLFLFLATQDALEVM